MRLAVTVASLLTLAILACMPLWPTGAEPASVLGPYTAAGNFSADLPGWPDTRAQTWGTAGVVVSELTFQPPAGYRVRILEIRGDYVLWPTGMGRSRSIVPEGTCMGGLAGVGTSAPEGSTRGDWMADNTLAYVQTGLCGGRAVRAPFEADLRGVANTLLGPDHKLFWKQAVWLNDTGLVAHMEVTFSNLIYQFEPEGM
jgi:hypothetical protein